MANARTTAAWNTLKSLAAHNAITIDPTWIASADNIESDIGASPGADYFLTYVGAGGWKIDTWHTSTMRWTRRSDGGVPGEIFTDGRGAWIEIFGS